MVDVSDLSRLLQKRASAASQHGESSVLQGEQLKSEELRLPAAPATAITTASVASVLEAQQQSADEEIVAHRAKYARYFAMLRVGIPRDSVEQAMRLAGVNPVELDGPHLIEDAAATADVDPSGGHADAGAGSGASPQHQHSSLARKKALRKRLYWDVKVHNPSLSVDASDKSTSQHQSCLWHQDLAAVPVSDATKARLEKLFVKETLSSDCSLLSTSRGRHSTKRAKARVALLEIKKAQNIGITLARVKLPLPQLVRELVLLNPTVLCTAQLQGLLDMWPDRKELEAIDEFRAGGRGSGDEDPRLLGTAEQFFLETRGVPRFRERLVCLIFKQEFPSRVHELRESIKLVIRGVNQICSSRALPQLLRFILEIGNLLNAGSGSASSSSSLSSETATHRAVGFSLSSLAKLAQTKAFTGGVTFLQFAVQAVEFRSEISLVHKCAGVSLQSLSVEMRALESGWRALVDEAQADGVSSLLADGGDEERRVDVDSLDDSRIAGSILTQFAAEVESELDAVRELLRRLAESKQQFVAYFDEQDTPEELDALLRHIAQFAAEFAQHHGKLRIAVEATQPSAAP